MATEVGSRNQRWHFVQKGVRRKVSHLGFSYDPIPTATIMFRIVGGKGYSPGDGDDLFRNHYSFMSIWKVQHASSLQLSLKRILSVLEVMYHM